MPPGDRYFPKKFELAFRNDGMRIISDILMLSLSFGKRSSPKFQIIFEKIEPVRPLRPQRFVGIDPTENP